MAPAASKDVSVQLSENERKWHERSLYACYMCWMLYGAVSVPVCVNQ